MEDTPKLENASPAEMSSKGEMSHSQIVHCETSHAGSTAERGMHIDTAISTEGNSKQLPKHRICEVLAQSRIPRVVVSKPKISAAENQSPVPAFISSEVRSSIPVPSRLVQAVRAMNTQGVTVKESVYAEDKAAGKSVDHKSPASSIGSMDADGENEDYPDGEGDNDEVSSWDFDDDDNEPLERPPTIFTGEYRTRRLPRGPTLRITPSAEYVIMGAEDPAIKTSIVTQRSPPRVRYVVGDGNPSEPHEGTPGHSESGNGDLPQDTKGNSRDVGMGSEDMSSTDMGSPKRPIFKRSISSPQLRGLKSLVSGVPPVPKINPEYRQERRLSTAQAESLEPKTPTKDAAASMQSPVVEAVSDWDIDSPMTAVPRSPMRDAPPIAVDSSTLTEKNGKHNTQNDLEAAHNAGSSNIAKEDTTSKEIGLQGSSDGNQGNETENIPSRARLPESKSSRMLVGFRTIFSKRKSISEKTRPKKLEGSGETATPASKGRASDVIKSDENVEGTPKLGRQISKASKQQPRLSEGATYLRNSKTMAELTPVPLSTKMNASNTPTGSSQPALRKQSENHVPSFARPTQSTITKAAGLSRVSTGQLAASATRDVRGRRLPITVTANGSPQSANRNQHHSMSITSSFHKKVPTIPNGGGTAIEDMEKVDLIRSCIDDICNQVRDGNTADQREKHLRVVLSLQQTLADYINKEKEFKEIEQLYFKKKLSRDIGRNTLFEFFEQVQALLSEEE